MFETSLNSVLILAGVVRIELTSGLLESLILPLNYTPKNCLETSRFILVNHVSNYLLHFKLAGNSPILIILNCFFALNTGSTRW